jgi:hypothetical protein|tara:strand:- start:1587 stop:1760 length:174 start_codon:yes stop_codon:yes gene_type:complete
MHECISEVLGCIGNDVHLGTCYISWLACISNNLLHLPIKRRDLENGLQSRAENFQIV